MLDRRALDRIRVVLVGAWLVLAAGSVLGLALEHLLGRDFVLGLVPFLDPDQEASLGTWVAALLHASCALAAAGNALVSRRRRDGWHRNWWLLCAVFAYISLDEVATIHDRFSVPLRTVAGLSGPLHYAWLLPFTAAGLVFLVVQARFLLTLGRTGRDLALCGAAFVLGAAGLETVSGSVASAGGRRTLAYDVLTTVEELVEFASVMAALVVLLSHLLRVLGRDPEPDPAARGT
ncbi:hypothetical protein SAMN05428996_2301 [Quadrisphaera sp. DSM 44207]|nr:hypothetical protein SAMN05428996_2301 [Quadrisphaera sp. DSM 44207]